MWNKSIGIKIFLIIIACVSIRGDDDTTTSTDSRTYKGHMDSIAKKEFKLIFDEASWYTANSFCVERGMKLAAVNSYEEHRSIENLIKDKYMVYQSFWISKSVMALEKVFKSKQTLTPPKLFAQESSNQCVSWYGMNAELCFALWPLANEWNHDDCNEKKYFICEQILARENQMLNVIEDELRSLVDELMFTGFAEALSTTTESTWISLVKGALQMWLVEQQQIAKPTSLLDEQVTLIAAELVQTGRSFETDELLRQFVDTRYEMINDEDRVQMLSERFRKFVGDEYVNSGTRTKWNRTPSDDDIYVLVRKVLTLAKVQEIKLASEELAKFSATESTDVLDEDLMKSVSQQLLKFSENEFESYVMDVMGALENYGVEEVEMNMLFQLYLLVKQELFSLIAKTVLKATSKERLEITSYGLSRILEGKQLIEEESVFGQIFVMLGTGTAVLAEETTVNELDDVLLRTFVKQEFDGLRHEDMLKLKYEGYIKFVIDEFIKLVADIDVAKSDTGELLFDNVVDLIATQFLFYAEEELKIITERLAKAIEEESNKLQAIVKQMTIKLAMHDGDKLQKLIELVQQELFTIIMKSLINFNEKEMLELAEEGLSKILADEKPIGKSSIFERIFVSMEEQLLKLTNDEFAAMYDENLIQLVKLEFQKANYEKSAELFKEVYMSLIAEEFIKLIEEEAIILPVHEEEKHQFGEMVKLLAAKLLEIANRESISI